MKKGKTLTQMKLSFSIGEESLSLQLMKQGIPFNKAFVRCMEKHSERLIYLSFANLVTDKERKKIHERIFKKILSNCRKSNPLTKNK